MTSHSRDEALLPRIAAGNREAVGECIERYSRLVWSLARGASRDPNEIEDIVHEIFIDLWKSAPRFDARKASEVTFIATIARRRVIDRRRRFARQPELATVQEDSAADLDRALASVEEREEAAHAMEVVDTLDSARRDVLLLSIVEGLTHTQIASKTGMPLGTVKSHARRGLLEVAERLRARRAAGKGALP